eukprot:gene25696-biopygen1479
MGHPGWGAAPPLGFWQRACPTPGTKMKRKHWPRLEKRVRRDSRWKAGQTSGLIRPLRAPGPRGGWGRTRGAIHPSTGGGMWCELFVLPPKG